MTTKIGQVGGGLVAALSLWLVSTLPASAGGSVAYEDVQHLLPEPVLEHFESTYAIDAVGDATRLGRQFTELGGSRVGPYHFRAVARKNTDLVFDLILQTEVTFLNGDGKATDDPEAAVSIREVLLSCDLVLSLAPADAATPPPIAIAGNPSSDAMPAPPALTDQAREQVVDAVRENYRKVDDIEMEFDSGVAEGDPFNCEITRGLTGQGVVRRIEFIIGAGDHGGYRIEIQCDEQARPSFVLFESSHWSFDPGDQSKTIDYVTQQRFYFSSVGQLAMALEKEFKGGNEQELLRNGNQAQNHPFAAKSAGVPAFFTALTRLPTCEDRELVEIATKLIEAQRVMVGEE